MYGGTAAFIFLGGAIVFAAIGFWQLVSRW
jgi:hypothetical protein